MNKKESGDREMVRLGFNVRENDVFVVAKDGREMPFEEWLGYQSERIVAARKTTVEAPVYHSRAGFGEGSVLDDDEVAALAPAVDVTPERVEMNLVGWDAEEQLGQQFYEALARQCDCNQVWEELSDEYKQMHIRAAKDFLVAQGREVAA